MGLVRLGGLVGCLSECITAKAGVQPCRATCVVVHIVDDSLVALYRIELVDSEINNSEDGWNGFSTPVAVPTCQVTGWRQESLQEEQTVLWLE